MNRYFSRFWPKTLRVRLMLVIVPLVGLLIVGAGLFIAWSSKEVLLKEKQNYLYGANRLLLRHLESLGGFSTLEKTAPAGRKEQIAHLNRILTGYTEEVSSSFSGLGAGYYHRELDAIITYGPEKENGQHVGVTIKPDHPGRQVMESGQPASRSGQLVRGSVLAAWIPIFEGGAVTGYVFTSELLNSVEEELQSIQNTVYLYTLLALLASVLLVYGLINRLTREMQIVTSGIKRMENDLTLEIPPLDGEMGIIVEAVNGMALSLAES